MLSESTLGTQGLARLLREARAAAQLSHPNIVQMVATVEQEEVTTGTVRTISENSRSLKFEDLWFEEGKAFETMQDRYGLAVINPAIADRTSNRQASAEAKVQAFHLRCRRAYSRIETSL